ncbi:HipA domain-containing protein [Verrucomicrobiales bacterium]|nr:HipA domain-containing protein [Verrucomicrobiales bacterium]
MRFKEEAAAGNSWLSDGATMATPPWASLRELEQASWKLQREDASEDSHYIQWLNLMIAPGSSLGGARPKAGVRDEAGDLWIAKLPGRNDERDMGAWEMVAHQLAVAAGLAVPEARLEQFGRKQGTYMTRRFDREVGTNGEKRIHFASAMTLLGQNDGDDHVTGVNYLDLVELIIQQGPEPDADLKELWRRIVFSIAIHNTDDHLRNHGFLLTLHGWKLSPAHDINPDRDGRGLNLNISETDNSLSFDLALEVPPNFWLDESEANQILSTVKDSVAGWRSEAGKMKISRSEQEAMEVSFHGPEIDASVTKQINGHGQHFPECVSPVSDSRADSYLPQVIELPRRHRIGGRN